MFLPSPRLPEDPNPITTAPGEPLPSFEELEALYEGEDIPLVEDSPLDEPGPLRYHPLHDLESLWWVAVYFVTHSVVSDSPTSDDTEQISSQRMLASQLFWGFDAARERAMTSETWFALRIRCLHPSLKLVSQVLERVRRLLAEAYSRAEKDLDPIQLEAIDTVYDPVRTCLQAVAEKLRDNDIIVHPLPFK